MLSIMLLRIKAVSDIIALVLELILALDEPEDVCAITIAGAVTTKEHVTNAFEKEQAMFFIYFFL
jgi:hypothetical protein